MKVSREVCILAGTRRVYSRGARAEGRGLKHETREGWRQAARRRVFALPSAGLLSAGAAPGRAVTPLPSPFVGLSDKSRTARRS